MAGPSEFITLSNLTAQIEEVFKSSFAGKDFWVLAEITNLNYFSSKQYFFFELIEKDEYSNHILAKIPASAFGPAVGEIREFERLTGQLFRNDIQVLISVRVDYHSVYGLKLVLKKLDTAFTLGALEKQRIYTLERLLAENPAHIRFSNGEYLTSNKSHPLPLIISKIAVISSSNSAGFQDFIHSLENNDFGYVFSCDYYFTEVQGENAGSMVQKLIDVFKSKKAYDVLVITRGGGSQTDFLMFDSYELARAVARFPIPVISGIGHQKNETLVDLMASRFTKTPTKAAEFIIAHNRAFEDRLFQIRIRLLQKTRQVLESRHADLSRAASDFIFKTKDLLEFHRSFLHARASLLPIHANGLIYRHRSKTAELRTEIFSFIRIQNGIRLAELNRTSDQIASAGTRFLKGLSSRLAHYQVVFSLLSTESTLKRGFAQLVRNGEVLTDTSKLKEGDLIDLNLYRSRLQAQIKLIEKRNGRDEL